MCVLLETVPSPSLHLADALQERLLPAAPHTLALLEAGTTFLLTNCGDGEALHALARRYPRSLFAGIDDSAWAIREAREAARAARLTNVWFEHGDITSQDFAGLFHVIAYLDPEPTGRPLFPVLEALHSSLRRHGTLLWHPAAQHASLRLFEAGFDSVQKVVFGDDPARPLLVARR